MYELGILSDMIFYVRHFLRTTFSSRSWARPLFGTRCLFSAIFNFILMNIEFQIVGSACSIMYMAK